MWRAARGAEKCTAYAGATSAALKKRDSRIAALDARSAEPALSGEAVAGGDCRLLKIPPIRLRGARLRHNAAPNARRGDYCFYTAYMGV